MGCFGRMCGVCIVSRGTVVGRGTVLGGSAGGSTVLTMLTTARRTRVAVFRGAITVTAAVIAGAFRLLLLTFCRLVVVLFFRKSGVSRARICYHNQQSTNANHFTTKNSKKQTPPHPSTFPCPHKRTDHKIFGFEEAVLFCADIVIVQQFTL